MKFSGIALALVTLSSAGVQNESSLFGEAFQPTTFGTRLDRNIATKRTTTSINSHQLRDIGEDQDGLVPNQDIGRKLQQMGAGVVAATAISFAAATTNPSQLPSTVANAAELNLSRGAIVIELAAPTTSGESADLKKSPLTFDEKKLLQTLLKNRKELGASIGRIQQSIQNELIMKESTTGPTGAPIWTEIYQEILSIEGDVAPKVQITPPADLATTLKDLRSGKLNLLVNGEIINISVEPTFGKDEDDLIIRIKGFKGGILPKEIVKPPPSAYYGPIRSWLAQFQDFWNFWNSPTSLFTAEGPAFLSSITNGEVVITGAVSAVVLAYVVSYSYYVQQNEAEAAEAAAKQAAIAEKAKKKKKKKAEAAAKKAASAEKPKEKNASSSEKPKAQKEEVKEEQVQESKKETEQSSTTETKTPEKRKRRHRIRFWKNK